jgi:hypothetical protein
MNTSYKYALCAVLLVLSIQPILAQSTTVSFQGFLTDNAGDPVADGTYNFVFGLWNVPTGGTFPLWTETQNGVQVTNGIYNVQLGSQTAFGALDFNQSLWLSVSVNTQVQTPRTPLTAVPYSLMSKSLAIPFTSSTAVNGGTSGLIELNNTGTGDGLRIVDAGDDGIQILDAGDDAIIIDNASDNGVAVFQAGRFGVYARTNSTDGAGFPGVQGENNGTSGSGGKFVISNASNSDPALTAQTSGSGPAGHFEGDVTQSLTDGGIVKAAAMVYCSNAANAMLRRSYTSGPSAVTVTGVDFGVCDVDFGFNLSNRFWSVSMVTNTSGGFATCPWTNDDLEICFKVVQPSCEPNGSNKLHCQLRDNLYTAWRSEDIMILVY